jgi:hypothetical protein
MMIYGPSSQTAFAILAALLSVVTIQICEAAR